MNNERLDTGASGNPSPANRRTGASGAVGWHAQSATEVCGHFGVDAARGLSRQDVEAQRLLHGLNQLPKPQKPHPLRRFFRQFANPLVGALLAAAVIAVVVALGEPSGPRGFSKYGDAAAILLIVLLNAGLGFFQEKKAERALDALKKMAAPSARVLRDGQTARVPAAELVPGDILALEAGDAVPADARLVTALELSTEESALTGESEPSPKGVASSGTACVVGRTRAGSGMGRRASPSRRPNGVQDRLGSRGMCLLAHGGGGRVMRLIRDLFVKAFDNPHVRAGHDGAVVAGTDRIAMTTDGYVVNPLFFPGGDIGSLAVHGTVNDLAMCGARPAYLTASFILEEGLPLQTLRKIVASMAEAARASGVQVVAGDTKVVEHGKADGLFITTAGVGTVECPSSVGPAEVKPGDAIVVSGPLGDHGVAVMAAREGIDIETPVLSDSESLVPEVMALIDANVPTHCLRDLTRGGLASALNEIATDANLGLRVRDLLIPVRPEVTDACELLGLDPTYVACEGRFVAFIPAEDTDRAIQTLRRAGSPSPVCIGHVTTAHPGTVVRETALGGEHALDMLSGEQLPRIC